MREIVAAVRQAVPDAASKPPGEVLEYVRSRLGSRVHLGTSHTVLGPSEL